jgi:hypothetical protein
MAIGGGLIALARARKASITATVTRADGRVEELGTIAYWHRNPLLRWPVNIYIWLKAQLRLAREEIKKRNAI